MGLCWHLASRNGHTFVWHNGQTGGYHGFLGFDPAARCGIVILSDCETSIDQLGWGYLRSLAP